MLLESCCARWDVGWGTLIFLKFKNHLGFFCLIVLEVLIPL